MKESIYIKNLKINSKTFQVFSDKNFFDKIFEYKIQRENYENEISQAAQAEMSLKERFKAAFLKLRKDRYRNHLTLTRPLNKTH